MVRPPSLFRDSISKAPGSQHPPEVGRYALYLAPGCPWAHRTLIVRQLKGLEDIIDVYQVHHVLTSEGWIFNGQDGSLDEDPLHGFKKLKELYEHADPNYSGRYTVPVLWDKKTDTVVNNESAEIIRMFYSEFDDLLPEHLRESNKPGGGLLPDHLKAEIEVMNEWVYDTVNNGVYKAGFSKSQESYDQNVSRVFESLDRLENILGHGKPYLFGDHVTEADVRLYTTLARFDVAYYTIFMCNLKMIRYDYPRLHLWLRRLYWDQDEKGETRGAFYNTTQPNSHNYKLGYALARRKMVLGDDAPLIVPAGPEVFMKPLDGN